MKIFNTAIIGMALLFTNHVQANPEKGSELHGQNCVKCHSSDVYTRTNARVKDLPGLGKQVRFCKDNLGISWFNEDVNDVIQFLNKKYYKF